MLRKIEDFLKELLYATSGTAFLVFTVMLMLLLCNIINTTLFLSSNAWMIVMIPLAFALPFLVFRNSRGGDGYIPTTNFSLPKKIHIPTIVFSSLVIFLGSSLLKLLIFEGKYTEFSLYNSFFAHRNGSVWNDIYLVLAFCIIPPVLEGIVFRGIFIKEHDKRGRLVVTVFSSLMFSLLTFSFEELIPRFFLGVMLCIVLYATDSITTAVAIHIAYNFFAVFFEPTVVSIKNVSSSYTLFAFLLAIATLVMGIFLFSHLSRLYKKYSHDQFGHNFVRSTPKEKSFWNLVELCTSIPSIACFVLYLIATLVIQV